MKRVHKYRVGYSIYRRNVPLNDVVYGEKDGRVEYVQIEDEESRIEESCSAESSRKFFRVTYNSKNKIWSATTLIPKSFMGRFLGQQGANKKKIEDSTQCKIEIPERKKNAPVVIKSSVSAEQVETCLDKIEMFILFQRRSAKPTHFVSFPLQSAELLENYNKFCGLVKDSSDIPDESKVAEIFMPPVRLHLTICMLVLLSEEDVEKASKALEEIVDSEVRPLLKERPLAINIKDLGHFGDEDAVEARVVYGKVSGIQLVEIAEAINKKMISTGLAKEEKRGLTLHMTLLNSKYVKSNENRVTTFDASNIMRDHFDFEFGSVELDHVKICSLNVDKSSGNYCTVHSVKFNASSE